MTAAGRTSSARREVSGWASGAITFASVVLMLIGSFQVIAALTALFNDEFFVVGRQYTFKFDVTVWGWLHLLLGLALLACGAGLWQRASWAGVTAIVLCGLSAVANFFFLPYYPIWAVVVIALDVWVIWALTRPGATGS
jgi:hypothetical protein